MVRMREYSIRAKYAQTNRMRHVTFQAPSIEECRKIALENGYLEPIEITEILPEPATAAQKAYAADLGIDFPDDISKKDMSYLISRVVDDRDSDPNPELLDFAQGRGLDFNPYIGKRALYNLIWNSLEGVDKIAFFVFCVYRYTTDDRRGNLDEHPYCHVFYSLAEMLNQDKRFLNSMGGYIGEDLRFFGILHTNNGDFRGGRTDSYAYQLVAGVIKEITTVSNIDEKDLRKGLTLTDDPNVNPDKPDKDPEQPDPSPILNDQITSESQTVIEDQQEQPKKSLGRSIQKIFWRSLSVVLGIYTVICLIAAYWLYAIISALLTMLCWKLSKKYS